MALLRPRNPYLEKVDHDFTENAIRLAISLKTFNEHTVKNIGHLRLLADELLKLSKFSCMEINHYDEFKEFVENFGEDRFIETIPDEVDGKLYLGFKLDDKFDYRGIICEFYKSKKEKDDCHWVTTEDKDSKVCWFMILHDDGRISKSDIFLPLTISRDFLGVKNGEFIHMLHPEKLEDVIKMFRRKL